MIAVLLLDAVTDNVIQIPLHWAIEFAQFTLAAYYFMGGAMTLKNDNHVRMDLIYANLTAAREGADGPGDDFCLIFYLCVLLWGSISSLTYAIETDERASRSGTPR
jgi:TRAP-type C4-dicarboxylate transport system permease small subunit